MVINFNFMEEKTWKYIVYETTNLINNKIYIGLHKTKDPNKFDGYIGNGVYITQPYTYEYAKTAFQYAVKKHGPSNFRRKTLAVFNTIEEASDLEEQIVNEKFLEREDVYNMVLGGFGGYFISNRIKVFQYDSNGTFIAEYESMADAALQFDCDYTLISYAVRYKCKAKGYFWNTDKVNNIDLSKYNLGLNHAVVVHCYLKTGEYYKSYKTQAQASKDLNISPSSIKNSRLLGTCIKNMYYFSTVKADNYSIARKQYIMSRPVYKYDSNGVFIKEYTTQLEAEADNKKSNITKSIRLKIPDINGFLWGLEKLENYNKKVKVNKKKQVGKYDLNNVLVETYDSATKATKINGTSVWHVLSGRNKTHKGYIYKYIN